MTSQLGPLLILDGRLPLSLPLARTWVFLPRVMVTSPTPSKVRLSFFVVPRAVHTDCIATIPFGFVSLPHPSELPVHGDSWTNVIPGISYIFRLRLRLLAFTLIYVLRRLQLYIRRMRPSHWIRQKTQLRDDWFNKCSRRSS